MLYTAIKCKIKLTENRAVLIELESGHKTWVPRSLIYGPDDMKLNERYTGDVNSLRIVNWKARELNHDIR